MSKKQQPPQHSRPETRRAPLGAGRKTLVIALVACLAIGAAATARWGPTGLGPRAASPAGAAAQLKPPKPGSSFGLAKEYVYAGGRIVATEEPAPVNDARFVRQTVPTAMQAGQSYSVSITMRNTGSGSWSSKTSFYFLGAVNPPYNTNWGKGRVYVAGVVPGAEHTFNFSVTAPPKAGVYHFQWQMGENIAKGSDSWFGETTQDVLVTVSDSGTTTASVTSQTSPGQVIISEFRLRGAMGAQDEFVELYNNTDSSIKVSTPDGSAGWSLVTSAGALQATIPNGTVIPARRKYLVANSNGYSLSDYGGPGEAAPDATYAFDTADNSGVALFNTSNPANFNAAYRLDAVGFSTAAANFREGTGLAPIGTADGDHSFIRRLTTGRPQDTGDNAADFFFISTTAGTFGGAVQSTLGSPGPENRASPMSHRPVVASSLVDPAVAATTPPNRERCMTCVGPNADRGTMPIRQKWTNTTATTITKLRFRVTDITTLHTPGYVAGGTQADVRVIDSVDVQVTLANGTTTTVRGTLLETPPGAPLAGGLNSTLVVPLPDGLAPGASVNVQYNLGIMLGGYYRFYIVPETLP
ncbi:MAG TPA: lamin tail domain-containing protein [Pyrinomonadaceae bacterium]|nr:lamin tail domain-containing protein [Pyrinomonadaceae bacterium]